MPQNNTEILETIFLGFLFVMAIIYTIYTIKELFKYIYDLCNPNPLRHMHIEVVETFHDCQRIVATLKKHCNEYRVLGFDCEWVTEGNRRRPFALLQLASHRGLCALIRLCSLKTIPISLRELLEDDKVIKVGIEAHEDAEKLSLDYGVHVASTFDLRYLAILTNRKAEGLAKMSKSILNVDLDKNWQLACSNWDDDSLTQTQLEYAAKDAMVAVEIFKSLANVWNERYFWRSYNSCLEHVLKACGALLNYPFDESYGKNGVFEIDTYKLQKRKRPKARLEHPSGRLLYAIDLMDAQWYADENLGDVVCYNPFTVRLEYYPI